MRDARLSIQMWRLGLMPKGVARHNVLVAVGVQDVLKFMIVHTSLGETTADNQSRIACATKRRKIRIQ